MTLHQLKVFLTIVKLNGVAQAARALHISQPSVSGVIQDLQNELGVKLFERLGNKRQLTEAGKRVLQRAEAVLANTEAIKEDLDELKGLKKGKIIVGGSATAAATFLPGAIQAFKKSHPGISVAFKIQKSRILERQLLEGEVDLAILSIVSRSPLLVSEPYREEGIVVIAPPNHLLTKRRSVPLSLLSKEPLIIHEKGALVREMIENRFAEVGVPFTPSLEVDAQFGARDAIRSAVASGLGIGFMSKYHVESDLKAKRVAALKVPELQLKRTLYITVHKNRRNSSLVQAFVELLRTYQR